MSQYFPASGSLSGGYPNPSLAVSSITINTGTGITGGGLVSLGGSVTLTNSGVTSVTGTINQVSVNAGLGPATGGVTFTLPQDIATTSSPTFANTTLTNQLRYTNGIEIGDASTSTTVATGIAIGNSSTCGGANGIILGSNSTGSGSQSIVIGASAKGGTSANSVFIGYQSGFGGIPTGSFCVAIGQQSLYGLSSGTQNTAIGTQSLYSLSAGSYNTAVGSLAGYYVKGLRNVAVGQTAYSGAISITTGNDNTAIGTESLYFATGGSQNTVLGGRAGFNLTSNNNNVCVGYNAGYGITVGDANVIVGTNAGLNSGTQSQNTIVGSESNAANLSGVTMLGYGLSAVASNGLYLKHRDNVTPINARIAAFDNSSQELVGLPYAGGSGYVLTSDTAGIVAWAPPSGGVTSVTGTTNQVIVNGGLGPATGAVTFTLPQDIATTSSPSFTNTTLSNQLLYTNGIEIGDVNTISPETCTIAIGKGAVVTTNGGYFAPHGAIAIGYNASSIGSSLYKGSIAIGYQAISSQIHTLSIGDDAQATGQSSTAVGSFAVASGATSAAFGYWTVANSGNAIALGYQAQAKRDNAIALGAGAIADGSNGIAIGVGATVNMLVIPNGIAIGNGAYAGNYNTNVQCPFAIVGHPDIVVGSPPTGSATARLRIRLNGTNYTIALFADS